MISKRGYRCLGRYKYINYFVLLLKEQIMAVSFMRLIIRNQWFDCKTSKTSHIPSKLLELKYTKECMDHIA